MNKKHKLDWEYIVHWIIAISVALGLIGMIIQFIRFGSLVEASFIGPGGV